MDWEKKSYSLSAGSRTLKWVYSKDSSGTEGEDCGWVDGLVVGTGSLVPQPGTFAEALDSHLKFTESGDGNWYIASGSEDDYYYDGDALNSDDTDDDEETCLQTIVESDSSETIKFHWKVSSEEDADYLRFYIDGTLKDSISGEVDWQQKSYTVSSGIHTLKWVYVKDGSGYSGDDCGWVDFVQWSGPSPEQDPSNWQTINYKHDLYGRRSEKKVDGFSTRYLYDGGHVIAEYDGNNNLLRKYIYGPGIDQPVCMIEEAEDETYYYHYDGLGSVVALSDSAGDTVQTYEYSVYGQVAAEDFDHPNPYMFAGRRFDIEIGLYYNRARYYNPFTGRFLQADPVGYKAGMNMYAYCGSNPLNFVDPSGLIALAFYDGGDENGEARAESVDDFYQFLPSSIDYQEIFDVRNADQLGMSHSEYIIWTLENWNDMGGLWPITEIYIYDHAYSNLIQIGDCNLVSGTPELETFCTGIRNNTDSDTVIHFRGCYIAAETSLEGGGTERRFLQELARLTERSVTGCEGTVTHLGVPWWGPDYDFEGDVYKARYNKRDETYDVTLYYHPQPSIARNIPDYIMAVWQGRDRPY